MPPRDPVFYGDGQKLAASAFMLTENPLHAVVRFYLTNGFYSSLRK